jgi:hypothetical protein
VDSIGLTIVSLNILSGNVVKCYYANSVASIVIFMLVFGMMPTDYLPSEIGGTNIGDRNPYFARDIYSYAWQLMIPNIVYHVPLGDWNNKCI